MTEKFLKSRIVHKHDTEADWKKSSLVPLQGEIVVYDKDEIHDYERIKVGDGVTNVNALPFADKAAKEKIEEDIRSHNSAEDAHSNMGWLTSGDEEADAPLPIDADTLGGYDADYFLGKIEEVQAAGSPDAVLYTPQELTAGQKLQARINIDAMGNAISIHNSEVEYYHSENYTIQVTNVQRVGRICLFCLQIVVNTKIESNYGFTLATLPFSSTMRIWINNGTQFYMDAGYNKIAVNNSSLATGNYKLSGFYFISE